MQYQWALAPEGLGKTSMNPMRPTCVRLILLLTLAAQPLLASAQGRWVAQLIDAVHPTILHSAAQGYLGVLLADVDPQKLAALKLKDTHGALITLVDHDAPAGQAGLRPNDVVLQLNGQWIVNADTMRHLLHAMPPGHKVTLEISREGALQTLTVQLADHRVMEHEVWKNIGTGSDLFPSGTGTGMLPEIDAPSTSFFHIPFFSSSLNVGALVEPLTAQMAEYLDVPGGLMVRQVARRSEAAASGLKAFDVILRVGPISVNSLSDWDHLLHAHQGKPVPLTILRDRRQQTLILQVDSKHHSQLDQPKFNSFDQAGF